MKRNTIAVMNTKGGVGKSTIVLALAETLAAFYGKNVLVIDSDAQASVSSMLVGVGDLHKLQSNALTVVELLIAAVLNDTAVDWPKYVVRNVSDIDDARSVFLIPSDMQLTLFEREVSKESLHTRLRTSINTLLAQTRPVFDIILIDCPPGLSVLTESWLREADYHLSPTKPDYVSVCGLEVFRRFKLLNPEMGFADNLGVLVNMIDPGSPNDQQYLKWLQANPDNRCFETTLPRAKSLQDAARFHVPQRSFSAKYPGVSSRALRQIAEELLARVAAGERVAAAPAMSTTPGAVAVGP